MDRNLLRYIAIRVLRIGTYVFRIFKIHENRILFQSYNGKNICDSPKYIADYILDRKLSKYEIVWAVMDIESNKKKYPNYIIVRYKSLKYLYYYATASIFVTNMGPYKIFKKRRGQFFINTWHGGGAYKRDGIDRPNMSKYQKLINRQYGQTEVDLFLSSCNAFTQNTLKGAFGYQGKVLDCGLPRNDILLHNKNVSLIKKQICYRYNIPENMKIVLYAPTWRDYQLNKDDEINCDILLYELKKKFGGEWVILSRGHNWSGEKDVNSINAINVSDYEEMQELLQITDILISDYSSCTWDFALTNRPVFLYVPDLEKYNNSFSFYTPICKWGYPYAITNDKLIKCIQNFDMELYLKNLHICQKSMGICETGYAREAVYHEIMNHRKDK